MKNVLHFIKTLFFLTFFAASAYAGPKFVILSAPYGAGHDTAAKKVAEAILMEHPEAEIKIMDMQDFMPDIVKKWTTQGFNWAQGKAPKLYDIGFNDYMRKGQKVDHVGQMPMAEAFRFRMKEFVTAITAENPDAIIATWHHAIEPIANARRNGYLKNIPLAWVHTDNVSNGGEKLGYYEKVAMEVNMAFLPGTATAKEFISAGVPENKIIVSGMPIKIIPRPPLTQEQIETRKVEARKRVGLDPSRKTLMIEAGQNGIGNYPAMIGSIVEAFPGEKISVIAATGKNAEQLEQVNWLIQGVGTDAKKSDTLYSKLKVLKKQSVSEETIRGWIKNGLPKDQVEVKALGWGPLADWRLSADVVGTKPGGLSTAEMAGDGIPMILRAGLASGQELHNVENFVKSGLAVKNLDETAIGPQMKQVAGDHDFLERLAASSEEFRKNIRPDAVSKWALHVAEEHSQKPPSAVEPDPAKYPGLVEGCLRHISGILH